MKKRSAEKVITRSILALATYRKNTMGRALRKRPKFWTVAKPEAAKRAQPARKRLRLAFGERTAGTGLTFPKLPETPPPLPADARLQ